MKLFKRITAQDIANMEDIPLRTAEKEYTLIRKHYEIKRILMIHYLLFNKISLLQLQKIEVLR